MSDTIIKIYASQDWVEEKLVQPDWSVNDETNPAYVKGRTHWVDDPVETVLVDNVTVEVTSVDSPAVNPFTVEFVEGSTYSITWNGAEYKCVAYIAEGPGTPSVGNGPLGQADDITNDEPFFMTVYDGSVLLFASEVGTHTVSISETIAEVHKLPVKYLPDGYPYVGEPVETMVVDNLTKSQYEDGNYENPQCTFIAGETYNVVWNGTLYENLICVDDDGYHVIMSGSNYPANIDDDGGDGLYISSNNEDDDWTVSVFHVVPEIHKLHMKYLPDGYPYVGDPVETVVLEETTLIVDSDMGWVDIDSSVFLEHDMRYLVMFDGVQYECIAGASYDEPGMSDLGNNSLLWGDSESGEPFVLTSNDSDGFSSIRVKKAGTHTLSIIGMISEVYTIDEKYLPTLPDGAYVGKKTADWGIVFDDGCEANSGSIANGISAKATGPFALALGYGTEAKEYFSVALGTQTIASCENQVVDGKYNIEDTQDKYIHIVGNGVYFNKRSNAHTLDWNGLGWFAGGLKVGGTGQDDATAKVVPTVSTATVGQTIVVKAVDENGKPTEWGMVNPWVLTDENTNTKYKLSVIDGKLTMTEVTE